MEFWKRLSSGEKKVVRAAIVAAVLCFLLLEFDDVFFGDDGSGSGQPVIGEIANRENDARFRSSQSLVWNKARSKQKIRIGDSVFTGKSSSAAVALKKGGDVTVGENSLVVFTMIDDEKMANLMEGNFRLSVNGKVKVAIKGEVTTLDGKNSEIQIFMDQNQKPQIKLLSGSATMKNKKGETVKLDSRQVASEGQSQPVVQKKPPAPVPPLPLVGPAKVPYVWKLHDLFAQQGSGLARKPEPSLVTQKTVLAWTPSPGAQADLVEWSATSDLQNASVFDAVPGAYELQLVHVGLNHWRVSSDKINWSTVQSFEVVPGCLPERPLVEALQKDLFIADDPVNLTLGLSTTFDPLGFVVEASKDDKFLPGETKLFWSGTRATRLSFFRPGNYFYRFRGVTPAQELTDWSDIQKFTVRAAPLLPAPRLAEKNWEGFVGDRFDLDWKPIPDAVGYQVTLRDANGNDLKTFETRDPKFAMRANQIGKYKVAVRSIDRFGRGGELRDVSRLNVKQKPAPVVARKKTEERKPSSTATSTMPFEKNDMTHYNDRYRDSRFAVEGSVWALQSSEQYSSSSEMPVATALGFRFQTWSGSHGFEGSLKSGVFGNSSATALAPKQAEARYHYRFLTGFPFNFTRELQLSLFGAYEMYRASGGQFSSQYDLFKFGTSVAFPLGSRISTGGEILYGLATDSSRKQEIAGFMHYHLGRDWSMGLGYRLHLFEAGSAKSAPAGLPYREGYTEGYSILNYHY